MEDIPGDLRPARFKLGSASYDVRLSTTKANALIQSLLRKAGQMERWKPADVHSSGKPWKAQATYLNIEHAEKAVEMFHNTRLPFKRNSAEKLTVQLRHSARFKIPDGLYKAIKAEIAEHEQAWASKHVRYRARDPVQGIRILKIKGEVQTDVAGAMETLEQIIHGQLLTEVNPRGEREAVWAPSFALDKGPVRQTMKQLERKLGIVIIRDSRRCQIRILGPRAKREDAQPILVELARGQRDLRTFMSCKYQIRLDTQRLTRAFRRGYRIIATALGKENVTLDFFSSPPRLLLAGCISLDEFRLALDILNEPGESVSLVKPDAETSDCAICWTPAEDPVLPAPCKHVYCSDCFEDLCFSGVNNMTDGSGIACQGDASQCRKIIPLASLQEHLSPVTLEDLLEASFKAHVARNLDTLKYCPTPDCEHLYLVSPAPAARRDSAPLFMCPGCRKEICTACHVEHGRLSCFEHRDMVTGGHELLKELKKDLGIKDCPKCGIMIERIEGCNRMQCGACKSHICWVCMRVFRCWQEVYDHLNKEHRGYWGPAG
ncbi:hypothetical protein V8F20_005390 [Naviculisporaceae sp. PSN 640]